MARATPRRVNEELRQIIETTKEHPLARPVTDSIMGDRDSPSAGATNVVVDEYIKLLVLRNRKFVRRHLSAEAVVQGGVVRFFNGNMSRPDRWESTTGVSGPPSTSSARSSDASYQERYDKKCDVDGCVA